MFDIQPNTLLSQSNTLLSQQKMYYPDNSSPKVISASFADDSCLFFTSRDNSGISKINNNQIFLIVTVFSSKKINKTHTISELEMNFNELAKKWKEETLFLSSLSKISQNPSYQKIIDMGSKAVPLILYQLKAEENEPHYWFKALELLTNENPVPKNDMGNFIKMSHAWLNWGYKNAKWAQ